MRERKSNSAVGLKRLQLDVDFGEDKRLRLLEAECGLVGLAVIIKLLCKIYGGGYFTEWTEVERILFASDNRMELAELDRVIERAMKWGIFSRDAYGLYEVLTSEEIQEHYLESTKRRQRLELVGDYLLVDPWRYRTEENTCLTYIYNVSEGEMQKSETAYIDNVSADKNAKLQNGTNVNQTELNADKSAKLQNGVSVEVTETATDENAELQEKVLCVQNCNSADDNEVAEVKNEVGMSEMHAETQNGTAEKKKEKKKENAPLTPPLSFPPIPPLSYPPYNPPQEKEKKKEKEGGVGSQNFDELVTAWNAMAKTTGLSEVMGLSRSRREKIRVRLEEWAKDLTGQSPLTTFRQILAKVQASDFLTGRTQGTDQRSWRCSFDFVFQNDNNWRKILEGKYDNATPPEQVATDNSDNRSEDYVQQDLRSYLIEQDRLEREARERGELVDDPYFALG